MSALAVPFEDALEGQDRYPGGYPTTNESVSAWRFLVKGKRIHRAAGICSGGEIGLLSLLPTVRDQLILVDHSYGSLMYAMQKYLLIKKYGFNRALELLSPIKTQRTEYPYSDPWYKANPVYDYKPNPELAKALKEVSEGLPPQLFATKRYTDPYGRTKTARDYRVEKLGMDGYSCGTVEQLWSFASKSERRRIDAKLDKVLFVHGGFQQLKDRGPFDLFYLSNAHTSGNGNNTTPDLNTVTECMRDKGWVIATKLYSSSKPSSWKEVDQIKYNDERIERQDYHINSWSYYLYQVHK